MYNTVSFISETGKVIVKNSDSMPVVGDYVTLAYEDPAGEEYIVLARRFNFLESGFAKAIDVYVKKSTLTFSRLDDKAKISFPPEEKLEKPVLVFVVDLDEVAESSCLSDVSAHDILEWTGEEEEAREFVMHAKMRGNVYGLKNFQDAINLGDIYFDNKYVFITDKYPGIYPIENVIYTEEKKS
jgi:hypothetical protein